MTHESLSEEEKRIGDLDDSQKVQSIFEIVESVLNEMGIVDVESDSVIAAPDFYDGPVLLEDGGAFSRFIGRFSTEVGCLGYAFNDVALLTVRQFCELYVADSYPQIPSVP